MIHCREYSSFKSLTSVFLTCAILCFQSQPVLSEDKPAQLTWGMTEELKPKVAGGVYAAQGQFPWQVFIRSFFETPEGTLIGSCGGSIIWPGWVLSAAHCFQEPADKLVVYIGDVDWTKAEPVEVIGLFLHDDYDNATTNNDIALLKLKKKVGANRWIGMVQSADEARLAGAGVASVVSGWGAEFDPEILEAYGYDQDMYTKEMWDQFAHPEKMSFTPLPIRERKYCEEIGEAFTDNMICAGGVGGRGPCFGDSGGPLVVPADTPNGYLQAGIVSRALTGRAFCGQPGYPGVFTRVSRYNNWIGKVISENK